MKSFHFRLQKVLEWRHTQLELEENNFRKQVAALAELDRQAAEIEAARQRSETIVRAWNPIAGSELQALDRFRQHVKARELEMEVPRQVARQRLAAQQEVMLEARRRLRLLEKLKARRLAEWQAQWNKELEEMASESFLARWAGR
jgi:flagellar export protein FliJ